MTTKSEVNEVNLTDSEVDILIALVDASWTESFARVRPTADTTSAKGASAAIARARGTNTNQEES